MKIEVLTAKGEHGASSCVIAPAWGGAVVGFAYHDHRLLWPTPVLEDVGLATIAAKPTSYGMPILGPTPGRVGENQTGAFRYRGKDYVLAPTRHGMLRDRAWEVVRWSEAELVCRTEVTPDQLPSSSFPFHFRAEHQVRLTSCELESVVRLINLADEPAPLDVGWHPYLARRGTCTVTIPASRRWILDRKPERTPTGKTRAVSGRYDFRIGRRLTRSQFYDDILTGLDGSRRGMPSHNGGVVCVVEEPESVLLRDGGTRSARVRRSVCLPAGQDGTPSIGHIQIYTPPGREAICIEPLTAPPNAVNKSLGFREVPPGGSVEHRVSLRAEVLLE